jgi:hypothetical protein
MKAVVRRLRGDGDEIIATVILEGNYAVVSSSIEQMRKDLVENGIVGRNAKRFQVTDGRQFIEELPFFFSGGIVRAEIIER